MRASILEKISNLLNAFVVKDRKPISLRLSLMSWIGAVTLLFLIFWLGTLAIQVNEQAILFVGLALLLLSGLMNWLYARYMEHVVFRPIETLKDVAVRIGKGELNHRLHMDRQDEIGLVADAFDEMADRLQEQQIVLEQHTRTLEQLYLVGLSIASRLDFPGVVDTILRSTFNILPEIQDVHIFSIQEDRLEFLASMWADGRQNFVAGVPRPDGLTARVARSGHVIVAEDIEADPLYAGTPAEWRGALIGVPLKIGQNAVGVMNVAYPEPHEFSEIELRVLSMLGDQIAVALENARLYDRLQQELAERKLAENSLASERNLLQTLIDNLPDSIYVKDTDSRFLLNNRAHLRVMGAADQNQVLGKSDFDYFPFHHAVRYFAQEQEVMRSGRAIINLEEQTVKSTGEETWMATSKVPLYDSLGQVIGLVGISRDITINKRMREDLEEAAAELQKLNTELEDRVEARTAELRSRFEIEKLVSTISTRFVRLAHSQIDDEINHALHLIGTFTGVDRSYIFLFSPDGTIANNTHEWCAPDIEPQKDNLQQLPTGLYSWWMEKLNSFKIIHIPDVSNLPPDASADKELLQEQKIQSLVVVPLVFGEKLVGFFGLDSVKVQKTWAEEDIDLLRVVGEILAGALNRKRAEESLLKSEAQLRRSEAELIERNEALRQSEERYLLAVQGANDGIWDWDLRSDRIYFSSRWKAMIGCEEDEIGDSADEWFRRVHTSDLEFFRVSLSAHLQGRMPYFESEHRLLHKDGHYVWVLSRGLAVRDQAGTAYRIAGSLTDISFRKISEERLQYTAFHDALTGLPNRALFLDRLSHVIDRASRYPNQLYAVLFLDLDRFKVINDSLGHAAGDQLLIAIARRLETLLRSSDTAARLGGDEFVILLEDVHELADVLRVAERIQEELNYPFLLGDQQIVTSASIGVVFGSEGYLQPSDILRDADLAMYRAKTQGRARYEIFEASFHAHAIARLDLENDLRQALQRGEFVLHYQEIHSLQTGTLTGFEALLRWCSPNRGLVYPFEFIPIAEETGLILPLGEWVLKEACHQISLWQKRYPMEPPLTIHINVSGKQFSDPRFFAQVRSALEQTGLNPRSLRLEITEIAFIETVAAAGDTLKRLDDLGVALQIDDFGTGYSSLAYLQHFPITTIKIDRSFISRIGSKADSSTARKAGGGKADNNDVEMVRTIMNLSRDLNIEAIAEGIETEEQFKLLKVLNCRYGQGFFFDTPIDREAVEANLARLFE